MKKKSAATATPLIEWEEIGPDLAAEYLKRNVSNRVVRKGTVAAYARDMRLGHWIPTHQGIAFNDRDELIDGQHRLHAIIDSGATVRMLVTHGIPAEMGEMRTMDAVDRGAVRSVADQLQLQHGYRNAAQVAGCGSVIASLTLSKWLGRITVAQMLKILEIYGRHIDPVVLVFNRSKVKSFRRAQSTGPLAFARAVAPQRIDDFCAMVESGANLSADHPALHLRNYLLTQDAHTGSQRRDFAKVTLNCAHRFVLNEPMQRVSFTAVGLRYFADRQKDNLAKIADVFQANVASFDEATNPEREPREVVKPAPPVVRSASDIKLTPLAEQLIAGKDRSDRLSGRTAKMQARIARGELAGAVD
jgi:hypothetical protein